MFFTLTFETFRIEFAEFAHALNELLLKLFHHLLDKEMSLSQRFQHFLIFEPIAIFPSFSLTVMQNFRPHGSLSSP